MDAADAPSGLRTTLRGRVDRTPSGPSTNSRARPSAAIRSTAGSVALGLGLAYTLAYAVGIPRTRPTMEPTGTYQPWLPVAIWTASTILVLLGRPVAARAPLAIAAALYPTAIAAGALGIVRWFDGPDVVQQPGYDDVFQTVIGSPSVLTLVFLSTTALVTLSGTPRRRPTLIAFAVGVPILISATWSHVDSDEAFWRPWDQPFASGGIGVQFGLALAAAALTIGILLLLGRRHAAAVTSICLVPFVAVAVAALTIAAPGYP